MYVEQEYVNICILCEELDRSNQLKKEEIDSLNAEEEAANQRRRQALSLLDGDWDEEGDNGNADEEQSHSGATAGDGSILAPSTVTLKSLGNASFKSVRYLKEARRQSTFLNPLEVKPVLVEAEGIPSQDTLVSAFTPAHP